MLQANVGRAGEQRLGAGDVSQVSLGYQGDVLVSGMLPGASEQIARGNGFIYSQAATGVALAAPSVNSVPMIWNPANSGVKLVIEKVVVGYVSATNVAGFVEYGMLTNVGDQIGTACPVVSLTQVAPVNRLVGSGKQSKMRFAPTTVTLIAAPTFLCPMGVSFAALAATTAVAPFTMVDYLDGDLAFPPSTAFFVMANAAVAAVCCVSIFALEVPIS